MMKKEIHSVKVGALLSYALILMNSAYSFFLTPYILQSIGELEFGVYKTISSLSGSLMVLDLGLGGTVMRYIAGYRADHQNEKIESFVSMAMAEALILVLGIVMLSGCILKELPAIYGNHFSIEQLHLAQILFLVLSGNLVLHIFENLANGVLSGFNCFPVTNGLKFLRIVLRILLTVVIFCFIRSSVVLVIIDFLLTAAILAVEVRYAVSQFGVKFLIRFRNWDRRIFRESFRYTILLFLTSIAAQVNSNLDNVVIGAEMGASFVTVYSMGLLIFSMFENLSTSISGVMLPTVTCALKTKNAMDSAKQIVIQAGRIQFMLLGAAFAGFLLLGKQFIRLWLGDGFEDIYCIVLILMGPSLLELCVNVCLSILRAKNMLGFRTAVLVLSTVGNAVITIVGVHYFGYTAAAAGTAFSFLVGSVIIMNCYYYFRLKLNMLQVYAEIFRGILPAIVTAALMTCIVPTLNGSNWITFGISAAVFCVAYGTALMLFGFNKKEKEQILVHFQKKEKKEHD